MTTRRCETNAAAELKARLPMLDVLANDGVAVRRAGPNHVARCPFHQERSGSFTIYSGPDSSGDHAHCFGCGWNGDVIAYWQATRGGGFVEALAALASLASLPGDFFAKKRQAAQVPRVTEMPRDAEKEKPALPRLRGLDGEMIAALAALRGLSAAGVAAAARDKRVGACAWPQFVGRDGAWRCAADAGLCWVMTDGERRGAQFRRMDGGEFALKDGRSIKAWTKGSPTWPLGAAEIGGRAAVLLVEGGADALAAYHFLEKFGRLREVAVCAMLGASCAIAAGALGHFARRRVRIIMDEDAAGREAAARWTAQLVEAGAAVEAFSLAGITRRDGAAVKDLNDLALAEDGAWWRDPELRAAFFDFDF